MNPDCAAPSSRRPEPENPAPKPLRANTEARFVASLLTRLHGSNLRDADPRLAGDLRAELVSLILCSHS